MHQEIANPIKTMQSSEKVYQCLKCFVFTVLCSTWKKVHDLFFLLLFFLVKDCKLDGFTTAFREILTNWACLRIFFAAYCVIYQGNKLSIGMIIGSGGKWCFQNSISIIKPNLNFNLIQCNKETFYQKGNLKCIFLKGGGQRDQN